MDASRFFKTEDIKGELDYQGEDVFVWFIRYNGDANSGKETEFDCSDITWNDYCEAVKIIEKYGYTIIDASFEHDYVSATFKLIRAVNHDIPEGERCKFCNGTGRWRDG